MAAPRTVVEPWARLGQPAWTLPARSLWIRPTPDGLHLAVGGLYPFVAVLDAATGREVRRWPLPDRHAARAALHPGGSLLAYSGEGSDLVGLDLTTGAERWRSETPHPRGTEELLFFPGGRHLLTRGRERTLFVWSTASGRKAGAGKPFPAHLQGFGALPDGRTVVALHAAGLTTWDRVSRRVLGEHPVEGGSGQAAPDQLVLDPRTARLWVSFHDAPFLASFDLLPDGGYREVPERRPEVPSPGRLALDPRGEVLVHLTQVDARGFDAATGALLWRRGNRELGCYGRERPTGDLVASADGARFLVRTYEDRVLAWDPTTGALDPREVPHLQGVGAMVLGRDAARLLVASWGPRVQVWDVPAGRRVWHLDLDSDELAARDPPLVSRGSGGTLEVRLPGRDGPGTGLRVDLDGPAAPAPSPLPDPPPGLRTPDGALEVRGVEGGLEVLRVTDGRRLWSLPGPHGGRAFDARVFPDGRVLASLGRDGGLRLFSLVHGGLLLEHPLGIPGGATGEVWLGDVSEDGELLVCGTRAGDAILLELRRRRVREPGEGVELVREVRRAVHPERAHLLALSPEGAYLAVACRTHRELRVFRVADLLDP